MKKFQDELEQLINKHLMENKSGTRDFILAIYLKDCLKSFNKWVKAREDRIRNEKHCGE